MYVHKVMHKKKHKKGAEAMTIGIETTW